MNALDRLAARIKRLEKEARKATTQPRLANSSIEDGAIQSISQGVLQAIIGQQFDGTSGSVVVNGPTPPTPVAPVITTAPGIARVNWSGLFVNDELVTMDFARVEVHASTDPAFTALFATTIVEYFPSPRGGTLTVSLPAGTWYFRLVARSETGKISAASGVTSAVIAAAPTGNSVLISNGGSVPAGTPAETLVFRKAGANPSGLIGWWDGNAIVPF